MKRHVKGRKEEAAFYIQIKWNRSSHSLHTSLMIALDMRSVQQSAPNLDAGFPALSVVPGQFLLKDIVLLAAAVFLVGDALKRVARNT